MEEWKECKLGDFFELHRGYDLTKSEIKTGPYPVVCSTSIMGYHSEYKVRAPGVVIGRSGTLGEVQFIDKDFWPHNTSLYVSDFKGNSPKFIKYFLQLVGTGNVGGGSAVPTLNRNHLQALAVKVPPLPTQQKIAAILSSFDDKIELNNKINTNLEQQAGALFKNWFVDFEPFGGKMPEGWKVGVISDFGDVICGKTPSTKIKDYYGEEIPFITIPDMHNSVYACYTERYLSVKGAQSQESKNLPPNSICVSCIATPGLVVLTDRISQTNQQINSIVPNSSISPYYVYLTMQNLSETITMLGSSGSTTSNLNKEQFSKMKISIPNGKTMKEFDSCVQPMFEKIRSLQKENYELVTIRDTLLPKLMNGEIEV
nr:restriction endonuclease subunit S [uncultured Treponema sp.]